MKLFTTVLELLTVPEFFQFMAVAGSGLVSMTQIFASHMGSQWLVVAPDHKTPGLVVVQTQAVAHWPPLLLVNWEHYHPQPANDFKPISGIRNTGVQPERGT
ncbi:MAG: hypothetical protein WA117_11045 [Verrucomicrobiia bacterium]